MMCHDDVGMQFPMRAQHCKESPADLLHSPIEVFNNCQTFVHSPKNSGGPADFHASPK